MLRIKSLVPVRLKKLAKNQLLKIKTQLTNLHSHPKVIQFKITISKLKKLARIHVSTWAPGGSIKYTSPIEIAIKNHLAERASCLQNYDANDIIQSSRHVLIDVEPNTEFQSIYASLKEEIARNSIHVSETEQDIETPVIATNSQTLKHFTIVSEDIFDGSLAELSSAKAVITEDLGLSVLTLACQTPCYWVGKRKGNRDGPRKRLQLQANGKTGDGNPELDHVISAVAKQTGHSKTRIIYSVIERFNLSFISQKPKMAGLLSVYVRNHLISQYLSAKPVLPQKELLVSSSLKRLKQSWQATENFSFIKLVMIESIQNSESLISTNICSRHYKDARSIDDLMVCAIPLIKIRKFEELKLCGKIVGEQLFEQDLVKPTLHQIREIAQYLHCQVEINRKTYLFGQEGLDQNYCLHLVDNLIDQHFTNWLDQKHTEVVVSLIAKLVSVAKFYDHKMQIEKITDYIVSNWDSSWRSLSPALISSLLTNEIMQEDNAQICIRCAGIIATHIDANKPMQSSPSIAGAMFDLQSKMIWFAGVADRNGVKQVGEIAVQILLNEQGKFNEITQNQSVNLIKYCRYLAPFLFNAKYKGATEALDLIIQNVQDCRNAEVGNSKLLFELQIDLFVRGGKPNLACDLIRTGAELPFKIKAGPTLENTTEWPDQEVSSYAGKIPSSTFSTFLFESWGYLPNKTHNKLCHLLLTKNAQEILDGKTGLLFSYFSMLERFSTFSFVDESTSILFEVDPPKEIQGVVFVLPYDTPLTLAMTIPTLRVLRQDGYAIVFLGKGFGQTELTGTPFLDKFCGCISNDHNKFVDGNLKTFDHEWEINWKEKITSLKGTNYYQGFREYLANRYRRFTLNLADNPMLQRFLDTQLLKGDVAVKICEEIYETVAPNMPVRFISPNAHTTPTFIYKEFCDIKGRNRQMNFVWPAQGYENYYTNLGTKVSTTLTVMNMTKRENIRSPLIVENKAFDQWLANKPATPKELTSVDQWIKMDRVGSAERDSDEFKNIHTRINDAKQGGKKVYVLYGKVVCDQGVPFDNGPAHRDMADWIQHTIEIAEKSNILLLVKPHPHELKREVARHLTEFFRDLLPFDLPDNVIFLPHNCMNNYEINGIMDVALLWNGTSNLELGIARIPVIMASYFGQYDYPVQNFYPQNRRDYEEMVSGIYDYKVDEEHAIRCAMLLKYSGSDAAFKSYRYVPRAATNDPVGMPFWHAEDVNRLRAGKDPTIEYLASRYEF